MYESKNPIDQLVHLYVDGALSRRDLVRRVARRTGGVAAAMAVLAGYEDLRAEAPSEVLPGTRIAADDLDIDARDVTFQGPDSPIYGHLAIPKTAYTELQPGVLVVHENRGLVEHIKDVTRRYAKAGFIALSVDLLSRQGGVGQFPDAASQTAAYSRTNQWERRIDLLAGFDYLKRLDWIVFNRIGIVGYCAGGGNVWDFAVNVGELAAAAPFYGAAPAIADVEKIQAPVLALYAERDRGLTQGILPIADTMIRLQKSLGLIVYEGVGHAFHNDTGPNYNATAAQDAFSQTVRFFDKWLRR